MYCDERHAPNHACRNSRFHALVIELGGEDVEPEEERRKAEKEGQSESISTEIQQTQEEILISMHAFNGSEGFHTRKIKGKLGSQKYQLSLTLKEPIIFTNEKWTKRLGYRLKHSSRCQVQWPVGFERM